MRARKRNGELSVGNDFILITDERVTKLLIQLVQKVSTCFENNIPNLADYSTDVPGGTTEGAGTEQTQPGCSSAYATD